MSQCGDLLGTRDMTIELYNICLEEEEVGTVSSAAARTQGLAAASVADCDF